ncbi:type II secretion system protein [bacterium]|nr:type II secretion system protein [bacterium]
MRISTLGIWSKRLRISEFGFWNIEIKKKIKVRHVGFKSAISLRNSMEFQGPKSRKSFRFLGGNLHSAIQGGFTLIELSLVILVIGIILSLVLPNIGIHKSKLEKERQIEKISQTIKSVYDLSQIQNKEIVLSFNLDENKFQAVSLIDGDEEFLLPEKKLGSALKIKDIVNFKGDKITEGTIFLIFNPAGFVEPATIHFIDSDSKFYTLFINPLTGQSRVENGYWEEEMI